MEQILPLVMSVLLKMLLSVDPPSDFFDSHSGLWSFGSFLTAFASLFVSAGGLYLIWNQLRISQRALVDSSISARAAAEAAKISHAATRPWIKLEVTKAFIYLYSENPDRVGCQLNYIIENIGNTPALHSGIVFKPIPCGYQIDADLLEELDQLRREGPRNPRVLFPKDKIEEGLTLTFDFPPQANEEMMGFKIVAAALYRSSPEGELYWTPAVLGLQHEIPPSDLVYRFYRGMGNVPCLVMLDGQMTPPPT